jgi:hypothetical protein
MTLHTLAALRGRTLLAGSIVLVGCQSTTPTSTATPEARGASGAEQPTAAETSPPDLDWHMRATFWDAVRARDALIEGDLIKAQQAADKIVQTDYRQMLPEDWRAGVGALQQYAYAVSIAPNLAAAAQELGRMALACGECHAVRERGPGPIQIDPRPWEDPPESLEERMFRHQQGADQMWDGLVIPSDKAWRSGTITITRAPLVAPEQAQQPVPPELHDRIEATRELGKQARLATTYQERGRVYGELIAGCAQCHYLQRPVRDQP